MLDKNGVEIKTGDVVEITGAFFKNDNGFWLVEFSPDDPGWSGSDHGLLKISKKGKISEAKYRHCFWPIIITTSSREKRLEARAWNEEHAQIEVVDSVNRDQVAEYFHEKAERLAKQVTQLKYDWGEDSEHYKSQLRIQEFFYSIAQSIRNK